MLMFAYGMNTNPSAMSQRCPGAISLGHARLVNHCFRFAQHADVEPCDGSYVDGVLWEITQDHLQSLDQQEGYPHCYNRVMRSVVLGTRTFHALIYCMQPGRENSPPTNGYFGLIVQGYAAHNVPTDQLYNSVALWY